MNVQHRPLVKWLNFWRERFDGVDVTPVIAGGFVRDSLRGTVPKDLDLFLLRGDTVPPEQVAHVLRQLPKAPPMLEWHQSEPFLVGEADVGGIRHQVMASPYERMEDLTESFDWNVCGFAFDGRLHQRCGLDEIAEGEYLKLLNVTQPLSTLRRGFRYSERFGMRLRTRDVAQLCEMIGGERR